MRGAAIPPPRCADVYIIVNGAVTSDSAGSIDHDRSVMGDGKSFPADVFGNRDPRAERDAPVAEVAIEECSPVPGPPCVAMVFRPSQPEQETCGRFAEQQIAPESPADDFGLQASSIILFRANHIGRVSGLGTLSFSDASRRFCSVSSKSSIIQSQRAGLPACQVMSPSQ